LFISSNFVLVKVGFFIGFLVGVLWGVLWGVLLGCFIEGIFVGMDGDWHYGKERG